MRFTNRQILPPLLALAFVLGCTTGGTTVVHRLEPRFDLRQYDRVGLIEFDANRRGSERDLDQLGSNEFRRAVLSAQPGVRMVMLGDEQTVLRSVGRNKLNPATLERIGRRHDVDLVIFGHLDVSGPQAEVHKGRGLQIGARSEVEATLEVWAFETPGGASVWAASASNRETVAQVGLGRGHKPRGGARDPNAVYPGLVRGLVSEVTVDFRPVYARR